MILESGSFKETVLSDAPDVKPPFIVFPCESLCEITTNSPIVKLIPILFTTDCLPALLTDCGAIDCPFK